MDHSVCQASAKSIGTHADGIRGDRVLTGVLSVYLQKKSIQLGSPKLT